jgi:hypothetical protein
MQGYVTLKDGGNNNFLVSVTKDAAGNFVPAQCLEGVKATYALGVAPLTPAATPTDIVTLQGSATMTVRVLQVAVFGLATTVGSLDVALILRGAANTGGTSTNPTGVKLDQNDLAATAVITQYSANPSALGSAIGTIDWQLLNLQTAGSYAQILFNFGGNLGRAVVLRGASQWLALNLNGDAVPSGGKVGYALLWTEESLT